LKNLYRDSMAFVVDEVMESKEGIKNVKIRLVTQGLTLGKDKDYTNEALKQAVVNGVFNEAPMFLNHQSESEQYDRPERNINDKVAAIKTTEFKEKDGVSNIVGNVVIHGSPTYDADSLFKWFKNMKDSKTPVEVSQHSYLEGHEGESGGYPVLIVDGIVAVKSVDFVTKANAGGFLEALESQKKQEEKGDDSKMEITLEKLKKENPEIVKQILSESKEAEKNETLKLELEASVTKNEELEKKVKESELKEKKESLVKVAVKLIEDSKLPDVAKAKLKKELVDTVITEETESLKKDTENKIVKESEYLKGLGGKVKVFANDEVIEEGKESADNSGDELETKLDSITAKKKEEKK